MANELRTYRHRLTGIVAAYHPRVASADQNLIEVADGAKPLAYLPIPQAAIEDYLAVTDDVDDEPVDDTEESR